MRRRLLFVVPAAVAGLIGLGAAPASADTSTPVVADNSPRAYALAASAGPEPEAQVLQWVIPALTGAVAPAG